VRPVSTQIKTQNSEKGKLVEIFIPREISIRFPIVYLYENGLRVTMVSLQLEIDELCKEICDSGDLTEDEYERFMEVCINNLARIIANSVR